MDRFDLLFDNLIHLRRCVGAVSAASRPGLVSFRDPVSGARNLFETSGFLTRHTSGFGMTNLYAVRAALRRPGRRDPRQPVEVHRPVAEPVPSRDEGTPKSTNTTSAPANTTRP
jgi:hypothetical protein